MSTHVRMSRTQKEVQRRDPPRLPHLGTALLRHDELDQWRQQAIFELQSLLIDVDVVISAMRRDMLLCRYNEVNK